MFEKIKIRKIKKEDAKYITEIESKITKRKSTTDYAHIIESHITDEDISFVAELDGTVVGYMISYIICAGFGIEKGAWIATVGVDPKYMGKGIGKKLAEKTFKEYKKKGIKNIFTTVKWDSLDLLSFFKTLGFDRSEFINLKKEI